MLCFVCLNLYWIFNFYTSATAAFFGLGWFYMHEKLYCSYTCSCTWDLWLRNWSNIFLSQFGPDPVQVGQSLYSCHAFGWSWILEWIKEGEQQSSSLSLRNRLFITAFWPTVLYGLPISPNWPPYGWPRSTTKVLLSEEGQTLTRWSKQNRWALVNGRHALWPIWRAGLKEYTMHWSGH